MTRLTILLLAASLLAVAQAPSTPAKSFAAQFEDTNRRLLDMARDFPETKYNYRATKDVRSFARDRRSRFFGKRLRSQSRPRRKGQLG